MVMEKKGNRWYDHNPALAECLESMRYLEPAIRDALVRDILKLIRSRRPDLLEAGRSLDFPLDLFRRRWYDKDPYLWLVINTLRMGNEALHEAVITYFKGKK